MSAQDALHAAKFVSLKLQNNTCVDETPLKIPDTPPIISEAMEVTGEKLSDPQVVAYEMAELLAEGKDPEKLIPEPLRRNAITIEKMQQVISDGYAPPDIVRAMVRSGDNKAYLDLIYQAALAEDPLVKAKLYDTIAKVSKNIRMDPEIGLTAAPKTLVNIDIGSIADILDKVAKEAEK